MLIFILKFVGVALALIIFAAFLLAVAFFMTAMHAAHIQETSGCSEEEAWAKALEQWEKNNCQSATQNNHLVLAC